MRIRNWIIAASAAALVSPAPARGQTPTKAATRRPAAGAEIPANVFADAPGDTPEKKAERLQKIEKLTFDRRPSTILKDWSTSDADRKKDQEEENAKGKPETGPDPFDQDLKTFQKLVTVGNWPGVKAFLLGRPVEEAEALYKRLVEELPNASEAGAGGMALPGGQPMPQAAGLQEKNTLSNADVIGVASAAPRGLDGERVEALGRLLRAAIGQGHAVEDFLARVRAGLGGKSRAFPLTRRDAARLLAAADCPVEAGAFLPSPEKAEADDDREALNLLSRHFVALHDRDKKAADLEKAWEVTRAALAVGRVDRKQKAEALTRAVDLATRVRAELGKPWLEESFTRRPERGMEVLAAIGEATARGAQNRPMDPDARKKSLDLQKVAVEALLKAAPGRAAGWAGKLSLLASAWLTEAEFSNQFDDSTSLGPRMQRDPFGNLFFVNDNNNGMPNGMNGNQNMPRPVRVADVLESRPGGAWVGLLDPGLRPEFAAALARLYLKVGEEGLAFPYVERLAATHPDKARALADEFVRVWARNHDPNAEKNRTNPYMFMFGFERKAEGIPLTRSKQERNLRELAAWVKRLRALPAAGGLDEALLAKAFTSCHSEAEVYRVEAIEAVFGSVAGLKPETLAALVQQMRGNLLGLWRQPAVQEQNKTKRREKDIRLEVLRGYDVARAVAEGGLKTSPGHWAVVLAQAAVMHDEANYRQEIEPGPGFSKARKAALARFARAAALYAAKAPTLSEEEETPQAFEQWFRAGLGACDLPAIDEKTVPDARQPALIRAAILALPGPSAGRHMARFANDLFTHMSGLSPAVKFRYLSAGFEVVGDHSQAHEARKVYDYYKDLVTEIKLDAAVDGDTAVGHGRPFGVFVNIRHTREIERESGGFGRYLQNQNAGNNGFTYNFGRPLENYRDKFQEAATKALQEHFEVLSVTFQDDKVNSRAAAEYGWRVTPYAYVLLKARGPEVDKVPPVRLDLDFLDTSGYVILPVESPAVPIDAAPASPPARPFTGLAVTQTLDERQAGGGKLVLEIKAVARGLVPDLGQILDLRSPGFHQVKADDQGVSVSRFDPEGDTTAVLSERSWLVALRAVDGLPKPPETFRFAAAKVDGAEMTYQRYADADLTRVTPVIALNERYGRPSRARVGWAAGAAAVAIALAAAAAAFRAFRPRPGRERVDRFRMPEPVTPFSVLGLLREIQHDDGLSGPAGRELAASIHRLERHYFAEPSAAEPDLRAIATAWLRQVG